MLTRTDEVFLRIDGIPVFLFQCYKTRRFVITSVSACLLQTVSDFTTKFGIFYKSGQRDLSATSVLHLRILTRK